MIGIAGVGRIGFGGARVRLFVALGSILTLASCTSPRIRVEASDPSVLRSAAGFEVALAPSRAGEKSAVDSATAMALVDRVQAALRAKGFPVAGGEDDALPLELALRKEQVSRRTYTADTDANGTRLVQRAEAIVTLRLLDASGVHELWRCEARALVPDWDRPFGRNERPSETQVFERILERALTRIPARP